jgi:hypothetical protein
MVGTNGNGAQVGTLKVKQGLAQMLKGGVIVSSLRAGRRAAMEREQRFRQQRTSDLFAVG